MALQMGLVLIFAVVCTLASLAIANKAALRINLLDHPNAERKHHTGSIPLTGGIAFLVSIAASYSLIGLGPFDIALPPGLWSNVGLLLAALVIAHVIDDIQELNALTRLLIDGTLALLIATIAMIQITSLGDLWGMGEVALGRYAIPMTVFAFIAASNAYNMTDGVDSLCSGLGLVTFATLIILIEIGGKADCVPGVHALVVAIFALFPLYLANIGILGARLMCFLGDSGARLIGFLTAIFVISAAEKGCIEPVMAFFPMAIPVCDCLLLMGYRMMHGRSPFSADRRHLHHAFLDLGFSTSTTRHLILAMGILIAFIGICLKLGGVREWLIWAIVIFTFACYIALRIWMHWIVRTRSADGEAGGLL